jgi:hypothetical protein
MFEHFIVESFDSATHWVLGLCTLSKDLSYLVARDNTSSEVGSKDVTMKDDYAASSAQVNEGRPRQT